MHRDVSIESVGEFIEDIELRREESGRSEWREYVSTDAEVRRWRYLLSADPYTRWGLLKPRGYPGDATLMDFAYKHPSVDSHVESSCSFGKAIYGLTSSAKQSLSARARTEFIADRITEAVDRSDHASVASFASGHGREFELLAPRTKSALSRLLAIDSDSESLKEVRRVVDVAKCLSENVFRVRMKDQGQFDLVYSLGLFDYLEERFAVRLIDKMWCGVKPGGQFLVANLNRSAANMGYCEAVMDWWMIQRSESELMQLGGNLQGSGMLESIEVVTVGCFSYLLATKK